MDSGGEVYNPNGTPVSSGSGGGSGSGSSASGSSGGSSGTFTAQDLADAITAGDAGKIIELVSQSGGTASPETQTVSMSAEDLGLPTGGTVTLTVTGRGVSFSETRAADADGFVRFEVPKVETNSFVTIELSVQDSNGTIFWYGRDTQQVKEGGNLSVSIARQFWTLPESLTVLVSPSAIAYNDTAPDSTSVTFSITNLDGAPDDAVFTYSWKDETGAEVGTGASLTRTAGQMLGASFTPLNDSETRTYSVDVSYTDASGSTVTSSGSATATIATAATLFVEDTASTPGIQQGATDDRLVLVVNKGTPVSLKAKVLCYGGTPVYTWSSSGSVFGSDISGTETAATSMKGATTVAGGTATVTVTADLGGGRTPLTKVIDVYVLDLTMSEGGTPLTSSDAVVLIDQAGDTASLTASLAGLDGLSGVSYSWQVGNMAYATVSPASGTSASTTTVSRVATGSTTVQVSASYKGVTAVPVSRPLNVVGLTVKESGTPLTGDLVLAKDSSSKMLTAELSACPTALTPADTAWSWTLTGSSVTAADGSSGASRTLTPAAGGKTQVTVQVPVGGKTLEKAFDVYVFELNLSGPGLTGPDASGNYTLVTSTSATSGVTVNASLAGTGMPSVSYTWTPGSGADSYIELNGSAAASRTVKPKAAGSATFTVGVSYGGTTVASKTVAVSVAGIVFTTFPKSFAMGGATNSISLSAEVQGYSGSVSWGTWGSGSTTVASVGGQTNSGSSSSVTLTAAAGGKTEITLTATVGGVTLTAKKEIYILQLNLACGDSSFTPPSGIADPNYKLTLIKGNPLTTDITANLAGLPEGSVSYTWTPLTSTKLDMTASGTGNKTVRLATVAAGNETVSVQATYDGESITKSVDVAVVGITLTGSSTLVFNSDPTANQIALTATLENIGLADLTDSGISFTSNATSIATVTAGAASGTGRPATVTALKGGTVTITVTAAIRASGKVFSAKKDITIIRLLVKDGADHDVPATGNSLTDGPVMLTAEFEDLDDGDFAWTCTPATGSDISISATSGPTTTVSGSSGSATVTLTATYGTTTCVKTMGFSVVYTVAFTTTGELKTFFQSLTGTDDNPAPVKVTGLTAENFDDFEAAVYWVSGVSLDLSATILPDGSNYNFNGCNMLVVPPAIPSGITTMYRCFEGCIRLKDASGLSIPSGVTTMSMCFYGCSSLTGVPDLSACTSLTNMSSCFGNCTKLTDLSGITIPASVTDMSGCFYGCTKLTTAPVIPNNVTDMRACFNGCTSLSGTVTINASITDSSKWSNAFDGVDASKITTIYVPDATTKAKLLEKNTQFSDSQVVWPVP